MLYPKQISLHQTLEFYHRSSRLFTRKILNNNNLTTYYLILACSLIKSILTKHIIGHRCILDIEKKPMIPMKPMLPIIYHKAVYGDR
jgi:hypothetical protein